MKIPFRHGIIEKPAPLSGPPFLKPSAPDNTGVDLRADYDEPVRFTIAHYSANYLFEIANNVSRAWGNDPTVGSINGPMDATGATQYLFWDINLATGALGYGWTAVPPIISGTQPTNPLPDTHWFDTVNKVMKVFKKPNPAASGVWLDKVRLFAGEYTSTGQVVSYPIGSQVGITGVGGQVWDAGNLILGVNNKPLKQADGTFVTTVSNLIINQTSAQNVQFDMALVFAQAAPRPDSLGGLTIPKFHLVSFLPNRKMCLASSGDLNLFVSGVVTEDVNANEVSQVITNGMVRNEQWSWPDSTINKPLFCGLTGELTLSPPVAGVVQQVGFVHDKDSVYINLFPPIRLR